MGIPLGSGPLGSGPTGPGSGFSVMPFLTLFFRQSRLFIQMKIYNVSYILLNLLNYNCMIQRDDTKRSEMR